MHVSSPAKEGCDAIHVPSTSCCIIFSYGHLATRLDMPRLRKAEDQLAELYSYQRSLYRIPGQLLRMFSYIITITKLYWHLLALTILRHITNASALCHFCGSSFGPQSPSSPRVFPIDSMWCLKIPKMVFHIFHIFPIRQRAFWNLTLWLWLFLNCASRIFMWQDVP